MIIHFACVLGWLATAWGAGETPSAWRGAPLVLSQFTDEPADALIRQVESDLGGSATVEHVVTDPASGLSIRQRHRWVPRLRVLFIDSRLTNNGKVAANVKDVRLANWDFRVADSQDGTRYRKLTYRNDVWYGSTYWTGPDWTRVGRDWHHPGINTPSVRRFTAPRDGRVTITGRVYKAHTENGGGDGVRLAVRHGARTVWQAEIDGDDAKGAEPNVTLDVRKGDAIRFVVHKRGKIYCDTTRWDPVVTYAPGDTGGGERFQASKGFSTSRQGQGGWSYEMEVDPSAKTRLPRVHGFGRCLDLRELTPTVGEPASLTHRDAVSLFVVADDADTSGIVLAMAPTRPWRFAADLTRDGRLRVQLAVTDERAGLSVGPGQSVPLPRVVLGAYRGQWVGGIVTLQRLLAAVADAGTSDPDIVELRKHVAAAFRRAGAPSSSCEGVSPSQDEGGGPTESAMSPRSPPHRGGKSVPHPSRPFATLREARAEHQGTRRMTHPREGTRRMGHPGAEADAGTGDPDIVELRKHVAAAFRRATVPLDADLKPDLGAPPGASALELDLWTMVQTDWHRQDKLADTADSYAAAAARQLERARRLLADLREDQPDGFLAAEATQLERLTTLAGRGKVGPTDARSLYVRARWLKRRIALANPLMAFGPMLFCKRVPTSYSHLVMQYYGWRARPGGGIFILTNPGHSLAARDILGGKLDDGNVLEPRLSYDARRIVFSYVKCTRNYDYNKLDNNTDDGFYHIYEVNVDGTGLRRLTSGPYDDLMPTYLPDGGIAFCSTRRRGYARCFGGQFSQRWHVYTLHRMDGDGKNLRTLSFHDTNEWFPTVSNTGRILYTRWDYIDRDAVTHQNLWATRPDGTNPVAVWGNATSSPHCTFQMQPIGGTSKIVFTASAHHSIAGGSIAVLDPDLGNNGQQAITRITPEIPFPEAEGRNINEYYAAPWPLSERYFLVAYSPTPLVWEPGANGRNALGIYLLDAAGNRELIYRDPDIGSTNPCPLAPRPTPPVVPSHLPADALPTGEMVLLDVYQGLGDVPRGSIKRLRIIQIFPKTTHVANTPPIGLAREENARAVLGTVPVEPDGSARFIVPARRPILFQALDEDGFAYQTMRSVTYVQPGERVSCIGCHEDRMTAPASAVALNRPPSKIEPGPFDGQPFSFVRVVQPVLDKHCVRCHNGDESEKSAKHLDLTGKPHKGFTRSYWSLCGDRDFTGAGTNPKNAAEALVPRFGARNQVQTTPPGGMYGARGSRLIKILRKGHYDVKLGDEDVRRLAVWIDLNAIFYGGNLPADQAKQLRGEVLAMPDIQ